MAGSMDCYVAIRSFNVLESWLDLMIRVNYVCDSHSAIMISTRTARYGGLS